MIDLAGITLIVCFLLSIAVITICGALYALQLVLERFLEVTLPTIVNVYARWRYPTEFKD